MPRQQWKRHLEYRKSLMKVRKTHTTSNHKALSLTVDETLMSASCVFATTARDRQGDILETSGIDTAAHRLNPIVLLDHGKRYDLPIGKTVSPEGEYTVEVGETQASQTTFFSQKSQVAEQTFQLIVEDILCANSIGWGPILMKRLPAGDGFKGGWHILECELQEVSWTALPANRECVTVLLDTGMLSGKSLSPAIKTLLSPFRLNKKTWINGAKYMIKEGPESAVDESRGGALVKDEEVKGVDEQPVEEPVTDDDEGVDEPLGAAVLRDFHADLSEVIDAYEAALGKLENKCVKGKMMKHMSDLHDKAMDVQDLFGKEYGDCEPLANPRSTKAEDDEEDEGEGEEEEEGDKSMEDDEGEKDGEDEDEMKSVKSLLESLVENESDLARKNAYQKSLNALVVEEPVEVLTAEEERELVKLERSLARKEKLISRLMLS